MPALHGNGDYTVRRRIRHLISGLLLFVLLCILINTWQIVSFSEKTELREADAAIVLGAGVTGEEPSPVFRERIRHGIWLYENGYVDCLIMTGGYGDDAVCSEAWAAKEYAVRQGVPKEDILMEEQSRITQENMYYASLLMEEHGLKDALIVSDPLHMKRAMLMASDYGIRAYSCPTPTTRFISLKTRLPFLAREVFFYTGYQVYRIFMYIKGTEFLH